MIYEHRTYTVAHGLMDEYLLRYEIHALPLQQGPVQCCKILFRKSLVRGWRFSG